MSAETVVLCDALARVIRANEALQDGETDFAAAVLDDLAADLWTDESVLDDATTTYCCIGKVISTRNPSGS